MEFALRRERFSGSRINYWRCAGRFWRYGSRCFGYGKERVYFG
jgi:hypothetical protein